jgi:hypothetical protein
VKVQDTLFSCNGASRVSYECAVINFHIFNANETHWINRKPVEKMTNSLASHRQTPRIFEGQKMMNF